MPESIDALNRMIRRLTAEAIEEMSGQLEMALRELREDQRLAVGPLEWTEGDLGVKRMYRLLDPGEEPPAGERWTIYSPPPRLCFFYTNHRGEREWRQVVGPKIHWGSTAWHPDQQWLVDAFCLDRMAPRTFALLQIELQDPLEEHQ